MGASQPLQDRWGQLGVNVTEETTIVCTRERPVLCLLLMLGTLWMGYTLYQFQRR